MYLISYRFYNNYGVGIAATIAIVCAADIQLPAAMAAPCVVAKRPPAISPAADNPAILELLENQM